MTSDAYRALAGVVLVDRDLGEVLQEICGIAQRTLPGAEATSITLVRGDRYWTAASTGQLAQDADDLQYATGYGPCLDAGRTGMRLLVRDMLEEDRWPDYTPKVIELGVRSSVSIPLPFQGTTIGALNNYATSADAFTDEAMALGEDVATHIGIAVMNADTHHSARTTAQQMQEALESRKTIDMALGILIATHHCSPDDAFTLLARASQNHNRKLRDLARALVDSEASQSPDA